MTAENSRNVPAALLSDQSFGNNGFFLIRVGPKLFVACIASDGGGWEHVSVSVRENGKPRTPTWSEMCSIKNLFWDEEDCVMQLHPPRSDYVNCHPNTLHLWRPVDGEIPRPPSIMVGPLDRGQQRARI
jgi:hypothetical protein